ncbi:serine/threonine-protein kinase [Parafrankia sp. EUN1f]|uniref:serine/threonine-protein kinase n=1 Tax=Parafrankia sp. EUN1f TaxID=102897 RepID=UPI0001C4626D|nr:serine/threonine-protein kinase [Parafrankia sp. EUN1f]EFC83910.1 serine/threonine protein kinase [Parafrankia sp. EUN1f]
MIIDREQVAAALPDYTVGVQLGRGGFGLVLAGEHRKMGRPVAIKVMAADNGEGVTVAGFTDEARVLARLNHPHVVQVYDYRETGGLCLVVMELLAGGTLGKRRANLTPQQGCAVGLAVATALTHAHTRRVLHRDIKAGNVLFAADSTPKVSDFGIAKMFERSAVTVSGMAGTPMYMAPEQIERGRIGPATDLYALGVMLYQLLTGRHLFNPRQDRQALWHQHLNDPPPPLVGVPDPLAAVVLRALAKRSADRQPDAHTFAIDLAHAATRSYGPGWISATDLPLHLSDDVRHALQTASPQLAPPATEAGTSSPVSALVDGATELAPTAAPRTAPPPLAGNESTSRRPSRRRLLAAGATALTVTAVTPFRYAPSSTPARQLSGPIRPPSANCRLGRARM